MNLINVELDVSYDEVKSKPELNKYIFKYQVTFTNNGIRECQVLERNWLIRDSHTGSIQEISGQGVLGRCPFIDGGDSYSYESWAEISNPIGAIEGNYTLSNESGEHFTVYTPRREMRASKAFN